MKGRAPAGHQTCPTRHDVGALFERTHRERRQMDKDDGQKRPQQRRGICSRDPPRSDTALAHRPQAAIVDFIAEECAGVSGPQLQTTIAIVKGHHFQRRGGGEQARRARRNVFKSVERLILALVARHVRRPAAAAMLLGEHVGRDGLNPQAFADRLEAEMDHCVPTDDGESAHWLPHLPSRLTASSAREAHILPAMTVEPRCNFGGKFVVVMLPHGR